MSNNNLEMSDIQWAGNKDHDLITFSWDIIDMCQYKCTYCSAVDFNKHSFDENDRNAWKGVIRRLSLKLIKAPFVVEILGGEPTLHPDILIILEELNKIQNCQRVELITNLAKPQKYFEQFNSDKYNKLVIGPSYHPEYYSDAFLNKIINLDKLEHIVIGPNVNLSDNKEHWEMTTRFLEQCVEHNIQYGLNFLQKVGESWKPNYTQEFWEYFEEWLNHKAVPPRRTGAHENILGTSIKHGTRDKEYTLGEREIVQYNLRQFKGWKCKPMMYYINMNGQITNICTDEVVPTLITTQDLVKERVCPLDCCDCDLKYYFYKERPEQ